MKTPWNITQDEQYVYIRIDGKPGCVQIKHEVEGLVVDITADGDGGVVGTMCAEFNELLDLDAETP